MRETKIRVSGVGEPLPLPGWKKKIVWHCMPFQDLSVSWLVLTKLPVLQKIFSCLNQYKCGCLKCDYFRRLRFYCFPIVHIYTLWRWIILYMYIILYRYICIVGIIILACCLLKYFPIYAVTFKYSADGPLPFVYTLYIHYLVLCFANY